MRDKLDQKDIIGSIFLDLRKAFDVIPHNFILGKLVYYGIKGKEYDWMKSYLTDRRQFVTVNDCTSEWLKIRSGVPQGSILGPLIFCLFINDLCNVNLHSNSKLSLYADDTAIFNHGKTIREVQKNLQDDFDTICKWLDLNNMHLHPRKTKVMAFGHKKKLGKDVLLINYRNLPLENVNKIKYLGVLLDSGMTWGVHISTVVSKISRAIGCIRRIKEWLSFKILKNLYFAMILPYIDYCNTAWGSCAKIHRDKIQKLQNKYARMILNKDYHTSQRSLLHMLKWQSVEQRIKYQYCVLVFKIQNNLVPTYLESLICQRIVNYKTRYSLKCPLQLPRPRTDYKRNSFAYVGANLFNALPGYVQLCTSLHTFKKQCKVLNLDSMEL